MTWMWTTKGRCEYGNPHYSTSDSLNALPYYNHMILSFEQPNPNWAMCLVPFASCLCTSIIAFAEVGGVHSRAVYQCYVQFPVDSLCNISLKTKLKKSNTREAWSIKYGATAMCDRSCSGRTDEWRTDSVSRLLLVGVYAPVLMCRPH